MMGISVVMLLLGGLGLPLGVPPAAENAAMQHAAPAECVFYATWSATTKSDPKSPNHTEQLLAEPEVQAFGRSLEQAIGKWLNQTTAENGDPKAKELARLGPAWVKAMTTQATATFVTKVEMDEGRLVFEGGLILDAGEDAITLADGLVRIITSEDMRATPVNIGRVKCRRFAAREMGPFREEVTIGTAGSYVLVGVGQGSVEGMVERLRLKQVPTWLASMQKRLPVPRRSSMSYVNTKQLMDTFMPLAGPEAERIVETLGLKQVGAIESVSGLDAEGIVNRGFVHIEGRPRGLLTVLDGKGMTPESVSFIPKDATFATAFSINLQRVYNTTVQLIAENVPDGAKSVDEVEAMSEEQLGTRISEILPALGDVWTLWMSPSDGWLGATATVELRDRAKLVALQTRLTALLPDMPDEEGELSIETVKFGEHDVNMLVIRGVPIRPSWTFTEDRLLFSLAPQSIKASLSTRAEEIGLFADKRFASAFEGEGETIAISYQDTAKLFEATYSYLMLIAPMALDAINEQNRRSGQPDLEVPFDVSMLPSSRSIHRHLKPGINITRRTADGLSTESHQTFPTPTIGASAPIAVALLLPAVQAAREAARRAQSLNNVRQIGLAIVTHENTYRRFPPAYSQSKDGKPLLSWRVHILPYVEEQALYEQFHLDEPWDSEHNKKLIAKMPQVYKSPQSKAGAGKTVYLGVSGEKGVLVPPTKERKGGGIKVDEVTDGTARTLLVVQANDESAVTWTKPDDYVPDAKDPLKGLINPGTPGFPAVFTDVHSVYISKNIDPKMLMRMFDRNDGEEISDEAIEGRAEQE
jgi:hypothetical protein